MTIGTQKNTHQCLACQFDIGNQRKEWCVGRNTCNRDSISIGSQRGDRPIYIYTHPISNLPPKRQLRQTIKHTSYTNHAPKQYTITLSQADNETCLLKKTSSAHQRMLCLKRARQNLGTALFSGLLCKVTWRGLGRQMHGRAGRTRHIATRHSLIIVPLGVLQVGVRIVARLTYAKRFILR